jgi:hypothetical protein
MAKGKDGAEKPLDKMTVKELREIALTVPDLTGVHGMNKQDLLSAIKAHRGIADKTARKASRSVREIKTRIRELRAAALAQAGSGDRRQAGILRRRLSRLKKKTRRQA